MSARETVDATPARGVWLHIERVVLDGPRFGAAERTQFEQALHEELALLLATPHARTWTTAGASPSVAAPRVTGPISAPAQLARQVAHSVVASLDAGWAR